MELNYYLNNINFGEAVLILGSNYNKNIKIKGDNVKQFLLQVATTSRVTKVIKMLGIDSELLDKVPNEVSNLEFVLINIAYQLLQGKELVINYMDIILNHKEEIFIKRLLIKLVKQYKIKLAIFTNNICFCFNLIDRVMIVKNKEIVNYLPPDYYNLELYNYIDMPDIINFVIRAQQRGKKLSNYLELSELIKGVYRL